MRKLAALALVALFTLIPVSAASAKSKADAFAAKHHLKRGWRAKDADKDGLKNLKEFKLGTNPRKADTDKDGLKDGDELTSGNLPRKADTDGDGIKDGAEHAGVVTAFDGATITLREFATGKKVSATLDTECTPAATEDDATADDSMIEDDGGFVDVIEDEGDWTADLSSVDDDGQEEEIDLGADDAACDGEDLEVGVVFQSAALEGGFLVAYEIA